MWEKPPLPLDRLKLNDDEVHLWLLNIDDFRQYLDFFTSILSSEELNRSQQYKFENLQHDFIINRGFLRLVLAQYLSRSKRDIIFEYNPKGKPFLNSKENRYLKFNLSHKNQYTIYGISKINLGVDLEKIDSDVRVEKIAKRFFTTDEYKNIIDLPVAGQAEYFFQLWTAKEAYLKATGQGISAGLDVVNFIDKNNENKWEFEILNSKESTSDLWQINTFEILNNYLVSVAIESNHNLNFSYYQLNNLDKILDKK